MVVARWFRTRGGAATAAVAAVVLATTGLSVALPAAGEAAAPEGPAATPSGTRTADSVTVTLLTGDRVSVPLDDSSGESVNVTPAASGDGSPAIVRTFTMGGDVYVVPASAVPYYGHQLDPSLFDVTDLAERQAAGTPATATVA